MPPERRPVPGPGACRWALATPELRRYHDREYGAPVRRERDYLERLILEIFQAGLSWRTVLAKRAALRAALAGFDPDRLAAFTPRDLQRCLRDPGIIRNRLKLKAAVVNAGRFRDLQRRHGSFRRWLSGLPLDDRTATVRAFRENFTFMGPEIVKEFLMSTGHWPVRHERDCPLYTPAGDRAARP
jgi:DNA-3-methyladenine glycosylase I